MRKLVLLVALIYTFSPMAFPQARSDALVNQAAQKSLTDKIDRLFVEWNEPNSPGCALGVIKDGQFIYKKG